MVVCTDKKLKSLQIFNEIMKVYLNETAIIYSVSNIKRKLLKQINVHYV